MAKNCNEKYFTMEVFNERNYVTKIQFQIKCKRKNFFVVNFINLRKKQFEVKLGDESQLNNKILFVSLKTKEHTGSFSTR